MSAQTKRWGKKLQAEREKQALTQQEIADKTGLRRSTVSKIENGFFSSFLNMAIIADALGLDLTFKNKESSHKICRIHDCKDVTVDADELWCEYHDSQING